MNREILLVEPNYKNKYPPMGLMKLATYYKMQGDNVTFFKGDLKQLVINDIYELVLEKLYYNDDSIFWEKYKPELCQYLLKGSVEIYEKITALSANAIIPSILKYYRKYYHSKEYFKEENRKYDRVGITTLFTFYFDITIETINFVKQLCKTPISDVDIMVGGVMATILPEQVYSATGIKPFEGTISKAGILDDNEIIVDTLPLDYSILEEIDYQYPASNAYYTYATRGCVNKCSFCAVPTLEPEYKSYLPIAEQVKIASEKYGAKKDLLLLDNNVLASPDFNQIIDEIKSCGFSKKDKFIQPNLFKFAVENLKIGYNDKAYLKAVVKEYRALLNKQTNGTAEEIYNLLESYGLLNFHTAKKEAVFETYEGLLPFFESFYSTKPRARYVDFNQGIDARLITKEKMDKLFEIPVRPVRIAFDSWTLKEKYTEAVRTAVKSGHKDLSNYILYNFKDTPNELYKRLKLNVDLCEELQASIYSFPMKYHPISDPKYFSNRDYLGEHWNRKFIRAIQAILNSTKGKIGKGLSFFQEAFGSNIDEFERLLWMPEAFIIYRRQYDENLRIRLADRYTKTYGLESNLTNEWWEKFQNLSPKKMKKAREIIEKNNFTSTAYSTKDKMILDILKYYEIKR